MNIVHSRQKNYNRNLKTALTNIRGGEHVKHIFLVEDDLSLIPISAKVHRRQNRMTLLCIIIAVFLVTAIFSMVQMWTDSEVEAMRQKHGDWHIVLQNIPEKAGDQIRQRSDILYSSWYEDLNTTGDEGYSINGKNTALYGVEESYMADIWKYPVEGNY